MKVDHMSAPETPETPETVDSEPEKMKNEWAHERELSHKKVLPYLETIRAALEKAIQAEKVRLTQMVGARDSLNK